MVYIEESVNLNEFISLVKFECNNIDSTVSPLTTNLKININSFCSLKYIKYEMYNIKSSYIIDSDVYFKRIYLELLNSRIFLVNRNYKNRKVLKRVNKILFLINLINSNSIPFFIKILLFYDFNKIKVSKVLKYFKILN